MPAQKLAKKDPEALFRELETKMHGDAKELDKIGQQMEKTRERASFVQNPNAEHCYNKAVSELARIEKKGKTLVEEK